MSGTNVDVSQLKKYKDKIWSQPIVAWKSFLEGFLQHASITSDKKLKLSCPYHLDTNPSAVLDLKKKYFKCFTANCSKYTRDPFEILRAVTQQPTYIDAFTSFKQQANVKISIENKDLAALDTAGRIRKRKLYLAQAVHEHLLNNWDNPNAAERMQNSIRWLKETRGIKNPQSMQSIGLWPTLSELKRLIELRTSDPEDWEWIKQFVSAQLNISYNDAIVLISATSPDNVTSFKLRVYSDKEKKHVVTLKEANDPAGFFGVLNSAYVDYLAQGTLNTAYIVEGEFDALSIYQGQVNLQQHDAVFLAAGGSGHTGLDPLVDLGLKKLHIIGDDDAGGNGFVQTLLKKTKNHGHRVWVWPHHLKNPKGGSLDPDEAIKIHGFNVVYSELLSESNYINEVNWALDKALKDCEAVTDPSSKDIQDIGIEYVQLFNGERTSIREFAAKFTGKFQGVNTQDILSAVITQGDTVDDFIERVADYLSHTVKVLSWDTANHIMTLWYYPERQSITLNLKLRSDAALASFEQTICKGRPLQWVEDTVGFPASVPNPNDEDATFATWRKAMQSIRDAFITAIKILAADAPSYATLETLSYGIHYLGTEQNKPIVILVNGQNVYKLIYSAKTKELIDVEELEVPVYRSENGRAYQFRVEHTATTPAVNWLPIISCKEDLLTKPTLDIQQVYDQVYKIYDTMFSFYNQEANAHYCALMTFYSNMSTGYPNKKIVTQIKGDAESGKSTLLGILTNHRQLQGHSLTYHSDTYYSYTVAGFRSVCKEKSHLVAIDEANESSDARKESILNGILGFIRTLATAGIAEYTFGTADQGGGAASAYCPVVLAGNLDLVDNMDSTRIHTILMRKNANRPSAWAVLNRLKEDGIDFTFLKDQIFFHSIQQIAKLHDAGEAVQEEIAKSVNTNATRTEERYVPLLGIAKLIGLNYTDILTKLTESVKEYRDHNPEENEGEELFNQVCNARIVPTFDGFDRKNLSFMHIIRRPELLPQLAEKGPEVGLYYDELESRLVVNWPTFRENLEIRQSNFGRKNAARLVKIASRSQYSVSMEAVKASASGLIDRMAAAGLSTKTSFSVFNVATFVDEAHTNLITSPGAREDIDLTSSSSGGNSSEDVDDAFSGVDL